MAVPGRGDEYPQYLGGKIIHLLLPPPTDPGNPLEGSYVHLDTHNSQHDPSSCRVYSLLGCSQDADLGMASSKLPTSAKLSMPPSRLVSFVSCPSSKSNGISDLPADSSLRIDDIAALVEQNGGTFVANLPSLKVLFTYVATAASQSYTDLLSRTFNRGTTGRSSSDVAGNGSEDISLDRGSARKKPISNVLIHDPVSLKH
nr:hypothetical protein CFP56_46779 [Quercus suber]